MKKAEYSLEGPMMKLQYFGHLMWEANSLEKILMLGNFEGRKRKEWERNRWLDGIVDSMDMSLMKDREVWCAAAHGVGAVVMQRVGHNCVIEQQQSAW